MPDAIGPLSAVSEDAITRAFAADPLTNTDALLDATVIELRRRRSAHKAAEAVKSLNKKPKPPASPALDAAQQAALDKPPAELTLTDLFGDDD